MSEKTKNKGVTGIVIICVLAALLIIFNILFASLSDLISYGLGTTEGVVGGDVATSYPDGKDTPAATVAENGQKISTDIAEQGFVMLKNDSSTLPLANGAKVTIMNPMSFNYVIGGTGSAGGSDDLYTTGMYKAFNDAGMNVNKTAWEWLDEAVGGDGNADTYYQDRGKASNIGGIAAGDWTGHSKILEFEKSVYTTNITDSVIGDYKTAIVTFSRSGAEGASPSFDIENTGSTLNRTYLQLSDNEIGLLEFCKDKFDQTIVLVNSAAVMELGFLDSSAYNIKACYWIGHPGEAGLLGLANMLVKDSSGKAVSPSGKLVDTYAYDHSTMPAYFNDGNNKYANFGSKDGTHAAGQYTVYMEEDAYYQYEEGIYVGYRWYETADKAGYFGTTEFKNATFKNDEKATPIAGSSWVYPSSWGGASRKSGGYGNVVQFPFGYGLSYATFTQRIQGQDWDLSAGGSNTITVRVTNTGTVDSRDVVQIYMEAPYKQDTNAGIKNKGLEKAAKVLVGFAKTDVIKAGEYQDIPVTIETDALASYDDSGYGCYVLEKGEYTFHIAENAHTTYKSGSDEISAKRTLGSSIIYNDENAGKRASDKVTAVNQLNDVSAGDGNMLDGYLSRSNFAAGMTSIMQHESNSQKVETLGEKQYAAVSPNNKGYDYTYQWYVNGEKQTFTNRLYYFGANQSFYIDYTPEGRALNSKLTSGKTLNDESYEVTWGSTKTSLTLEDMKDEDGVALAYDDPKWQTLLNQVTLDEAITLHGKSGWSTAGIASVGKGETKNADGPGEGNHKQRVGNTWWPCAVVIASTWNTDLALEQGVEYGRQAGIDLSGAYAPAMNTHRTPFGGRNFEYYSEDGFIAGKIGSNVVIGVQSTDTMVYIKHFALNDGDTNRNGVNTWASEQAIREIYCVPYELSIKEGNALGIMGSLNKIGMSWGHYGLYNNITRNEWGFNGYLITDGVPPFGGRLYNGPSMCLMVGVAMLSNGDNVTNAIYTNYEGTGATTTAYGQYLLRENTHRMLYQLVASGDPLRRVVPNTAWKIAWILLDVALGAGIVLVYIFMVHRQLVLPLIRKKK